MKPLLEQLRRVNVLATAMLVALIFASFGSILLYKGLGGASGEVTAEIFGSRWRIESASGGIILCLASLFISAATLACDRKKKHDISIKLGTHEFKWSGTFTTIEELEAAGLALKVFFETKEGPNKAD